MWFFIKGFARAWKMLFLAIVLVLAGMAALSACAGTPVEETPPAEDLFLGAETLLEDETGQTYATIRVTVPQAAYAGLADPQWQEAISRRLEQIGRDFLDSRQQEAEAQKQANPAYQGEYSMQVALFYADSTMASFRAELYDSVLGAAHPLQTARGYTFGPDGEPLDLADLLGADYLETVPSAILSQIQAAGEEENYYPNLAQLLAEGLAADKWYADDQAVYVMYDPYEIAAYAMGIQEFAVPRVSETDSLVENISFPAGTFSSLAPSNENKNPAY